MDVIDIARLAVVPDGITPTAVRERILASAYHDDVGRRLTGVWETGSGRKANSRKTVAPHVQQSSPDQDVPNTTRDADLWRRVAADDEAAFTELVDAYALILHKFACVILDDEDMALDVVQDVFVRCWTLRHTIAVDHVADYLFGAVRNRARNVLRHVKSQTRIAQRIREQYVINPATSAEAADARVMTQEFATALAAAIDSLTPRVRETFLLSRVQHMSYAEIASALGVSVSTVQSQLSRAMSHIMTALAPFR